MRSGFWRLCATTVATAGCVTLGGTTLLAQATTPAVRDTATIRRITITASGVQLVDVLSRLRQEFGVAIAWSGDIVPDKRISINMRNARVHDVLNAILADTGLDFFVTRLGTIVIFATRNPAAVVAPSRAPDAQSIAHSLSATGVRQLDAVVIIGSAVAPSPEREQPTAIGIVRPPQLAPGTYTNISDVIRTHLPGVILWDRGPVGGSVPVAALRGVSSFTTRAVKTYVDGIELASPELFALIDVHSIDRIELIRGPQGAALYGPDALNGFLQIETRRGQPGANGIRTRGTAAAGTLRRDEIANADLVQDYSLGVTGARGLNAFDVGAAFAQTGIGDAFPRMKSWNVNAGGRSLFGPFTLDASARAGRREYSVDSVNALGNVVSDTREPRALEERAVAVALVHSLSERWKQTVIAGYQHSAGVREPFHSPLIAPTLPLGATDETASRTSLRYSASFDASEAFTLSGGVEHSLRTIERVARGPMSLYQRFPNLRSTGAFAQGRARMGRLVLSGGTRAEELSSVGSDIGLLWASTAGASWSREFHPATVRLRAAWGNGIRPPNQE